MKKQCWALFFLLQLRQILLLAYWTLTTELFNCFHIWLWLKKNGNCFLILCFLLKQGGVTGTIILVCSKGKDSHILTFNEEVFFIYLLPPIIFNAGFVQVSGFIFVYACWIVHVSRTYLPVCRFQVKKKQFFHNFLTIMLFGVIGVFISALIITSGISQIYSATNS